MRGTEQGGKMKKLLLVMGILGMCLSLGAWEKDNFSFNTYLNSEFGSHLNAPDKPMKMYKSLQLKSTFDFSQDVSLFFNLKKYYDMVYDVTGEYKDGSYKTATNTGNLWLREAFLDVKHSPVFLRLGKQQVVWGTADGVRILDCINPGDSRYAYLDDASEYRIPLWMIRLEVSPITDASLQFLAIPDYEPNYNAGYGDVFVYRVADRPAPPPTVRYIVEDRLPEDGFGDPTYAVRWQQVVNGWEYTLNYKYGYEFYPSVTTTFTPPVLPPPIFIPPILRLTKEYQRTHTFGASFTKAINEGNLAGLTVRGEFMYTQDKPFPYVYAYANNSPLFRTDTQDTFAYVLGLDRYFFTDLLASFQFIQFVNSADKVNGLAILHPATLAPQNKVETMGTLKLSKDFFNERVKPEVLVVFGGTGDWRISPKVSYEVNDKLTLYAGIHYFAGRLNTLYGEFEQDSMLYLGATLSF